MELSKWETQVRQDFKRSQSITNYNTIKIYYGGFVKTCSNVGNEVKI